MTYNHCVVQNFNETFTCLDCKLIIKKRSHAIAHATKDLVFQKPISNSSETPNSSNQSQEDCHTEQEL